MIMINSGREWDWMDKKTKMGKELNLSTEECLILIDSIEDKIYNLNWVIKDYLRLDQTEMINKVSHKIDILVKLKEELKLLNQKKDEEVGKSGKVQ
jgi:hypothetical protein